ncbi:MAG: hypothetical protein M0Q43_05600 [Methanothrix sp.]|nr:hypothetical protein [Methanothrix sp.]
MAGFKVRGFEYTSHLAEGFQFHLALRPDRPSARPSTIACHVIQPALTTAQTRLGPQATSHE